MDNNLPVDFSKKWAVMTAVSLGIFLATIDSSIVNIALPTLVKELNTTFALVQWVVLGYLLTVTTLMLSIGRLSDMIGKKKLYTAGFIIFTFGSLFCALSENIYLLIGARIFQAIGASMMMSLGTAIITENFPPSERGRAIGISGVMVSLGIIAGPTIGGLILGVASWHWIFIVNLPLGIIGTIVVIRSLPNRVPGIKQKFDFPGAIVLFLALSAVLIGLTSAEEWGITHPVILGLLFASVVLAVVFLQIESKSDHPMIDLKLFQSRLFSINLITGFITFIAIAGITLIMPFYLQDIQGYSPQMAGFMMAIVPIMLGIMAPLSGILSDKYGTRILTIIGLVSLCIAYWGIGTLQVNTGVFGFVLRFLPLGMGMGIFQTPNNSTIMSSAPRERLGVASGLLSLTRTLGQITGIALIGMLWTSRVMAYNLSPIKSSMEATPIAQVAGLQDTMHYVLVLIIIALVLSIFAWYTEKNQVLQTEVRDFVK